MCKDVKIGGLAFMHGGVIQVGLGKRSIAMRSARWDDLFDWAGEVFLVLGFLG